MTNENVSEGRVFVKNVSIKTAFFVGFSLFLLINIKDVNATSTLEILENTDKCIFNVDDMLDYCYSRYILCDQDDKLKTKNISFKFYDTKNWLVEEEKIKKKLQHTVDSTKINDSCYEIFIDGWKNPFINLDNVLCYDGDCFYEYAWWNTSMTRYPLITLNNLSDPFLVNDTFGLDIGGGIQYIWCNATATFIYNDTSGNIFCTNDTEQIPTFIDEGNGTDFGNTSVDMLFWVPLNGTDGFDKSIYNIGLSATSGDPTSEFAKIGNGVNFDGTDCLDWGNQPSVETPQNLTISFWYKPGETGVDSVIFAYDDRNTGENSLIIGTNVNGNYTFALLLENLETQIVGGTVEVGVWDYLSFTYDGTTKKLHENGILLASGSTETGDIEYHGTEHLTAGCRFRAGIPYQLHCDGVIDNAVMLNRTKGIDEIQADYNNTHPDGYSNLGNFQTFFFTIFSPENITYNITSIPLISNSSAVIDTWWYSLNGGNNITFNNTGDTIIAQEGNNVIIVYGNQTDGSILNAVQFFTVIIPPEPPPSYSFTVYKLVDTGIPFIGSFLESLTWESVIFHMNRLTVNGNAFIDGDLTVSGDISGGPIILEVTNVTNNITDINGTDVWLNTVAINRTNVRPGYVLDVNGNARINGNVTVNGSISTLLDSLSFLNNSGAVVARMSAIQTQIGAATFESVRVDENFGSEANKSGMLFIGVRNLNHDNTSSVSIGLSNSINDGYSMFKYNLNNPFHNRSGVLANEFGDHLILQSNDEGNISIGFFDAASVSPNFAVEGFINTTSVIDIMRKSLGFVTRFNFGVVMASFLNVSGNINVGGNIEMNNNNITSILSTVYNVSGCTDDTEGTLCYDADFDTLRFSTLSGQINQMNQKTTMPSKNLEGETVLDGSVVYVTGATGANPNFKLAKADNLSTSGLVGVVTKDCVNNQVCPVVFFAMVHNIDTSAFSVNDHLYLSATEAGNFTTTPPEFPDVPLWVASPVRIHTDGSIFVFPQLDSSNGITMNNLGLVGDFIQTDYKIKSLEGHANMNGKNVMCIEMNGTTGEDVCHVVFQPGGTGQASIWTRSGLVVPENLDCLNTTNRTDAQCWADVGGFSWQINDFNTTNTEGADWGITGELEVIKDVLTHGNLDVEGNFTGNQFSGEMWFHNDTVGNVTNLVEDVWNIATPFDQNANDQKLNGFTYTNSELTVKVAGLYSVNFGVSFTGTVNNKYHTTIGVNGTDQISTETHDRISTGSDILGSKGGGFLRLNINDNVTLMMMNEDSGGDATILSANVNLFRIGD